MMAIAAAAAAVIEDDALRGMKVLMSNSLLCPAVLLLFDTYH
jgi:hypothetical protein